MGSPLPFPKLPLRAPLSAKSRCRSSSTEWQGGCGKAPRIISVCVISWLSDTCSRSRGFLVPTLPQASFAPGPQAGVWVRQKLQPDVEDLSQHKDQPPDLLNGADNIQLWIPFQSPFVTTLPFYPHKSPREGWAGGLPISTRTPSPIALQRASAGALLLFHVLQVGKLRPKVGL